MDSLIIGDLVHQPAANGRHVAGIYRCNVMLATQPFIDRGRIGVLGICGSGSFGIGAAKIDPRMKAIATVSMYDMGGRQPQPKQSRYLAAMVKLKASDKITLHMGFSKP